MSTFKATNKKKKKDDDVFKATSRKTYDSVLVSSWETEAEESFGKIKNYLTKMDNGEYLSSKDLEDYKSAMERYIDKASRLRGINKSLGNSYSEEEEKEWSDSVNSLKTGFKDSSKIYSSFKNEKEYKNALEAIKNRDTMRAEDIDALKSSLAPYEETFGIARDVYDNWEMPKVGQLNEKATKERGVITYYNAKDVAEATKKRDEAVARGISAHLGVDNMSYFDLMEEVETRKKYITQTQYLQNYFYLTENDVPLEEIASHLNDADPIAYTDLDGKNVTWQKLYDKKLWEQNFYDVYNQHSKNSDWSEKAKYNSRLKGKNVFELEGLDEHFEQGSTGDFGDELLIEYINADEKTQDRISYLRYAEANAHFGKKGIHVDKNHYDYSQEGYDCLTEDEKELLTYLFYTDKAAFKEMKTFLKDELLVRKEQKELTKIYEKAQKNPFEYSMASIAYNLEGGLEFLTDAITGETEGGNHAAAMSSNIRKAVSDKVDWEIKGWDAFDFLYNTSMSMADSAVSMVGFGQLGGVALGLSAAGQGVNDALDRGLTGSDVFMHGFMSGTFEMLFETISIGQFSALKDSLGTGIKNIAKNVGKSMLVNASEETLTELANIAYDTVANADFSQYETMVRTYVMQGMTIEQAESQAKRDFRRQVAESAASGLAMGLGFGGIASASSHFKAKKIESSFDAESVEALINEGLSVPDSDAYYLALDAAAKINDGGSLSAQELVNLQNANEKAFKENDISKITSAVEARLTELGEAGDVSAIAKAIAKQILGKRLSSAEKNIFKNSKYGQRVANEISPKNIASGNYASNWARTIGTDRINTDAYNDSVFDIAREMVAPSETAVEETNVAPKPSTAPFAMLSPDYIAKKAKEYEALGLSAEESKAMVMTEFSIANQGKSTPTAENAVENEYEANADGKTINRKTDKVVKVKNISSISKSGEANLTLDDGMVVKASDLAFGSDAEAVIVGNIGKMKIGDNPINTSSANLLYNAAMNEFNESAEKTGGKASEIIRGLIESYMFGVYNLGKSKLTDKNGQAVFAGKLSQARRAYAYDLGAKDSVKRVEAKQKTIDELKTKAKPTKKAVGKVIFEDGANVDESTLTATQKANLNGIKLLAEISNIEFHVFRSEKVGKSFKYTMPNGNVVSANGWYVSGTNEIWIDLNAGEAGEGTMIRTAAHEISHYIKQWSLTKWQAMADLLMESFAKNGVNTESMLDRQISKIKRRHTKETMPSEPKLLDMAHEELVSDALTDMLTDGSIVNFIAEVKAKDRNLWRKIGDAIKSLLNKWGLLTKDYKGRSLDTAEAQALSQLEDTFKKLQEMYRDAFMDANETVEAVGKGMFVDKISEKFEMRNAVEETADLLALHNITPELLLKVLNRGMFIAPSIAVTNKLFTKFGEISVAFYKDSIDPAVSWKNFLFNSDAWTQQEPDIKKNATFDPAKTKQTLQSIKNMIGIKAALEIFSMNQSKFEKEIKKKKGSSFEAFKHNLGVQTAYALENGLIDSIPKLDNGKVDKKALANLIKSQLYEHTNWGKYRRWLNGISDTIISSFDEATTVEIFKEMMKQPASSKEFELSLNENLIVPAERYNTLDDLAADKNRLVESDVAEKSSKILAQKMLVWADKVSEKENIAKSKVVDAIKAAFKSRNNVDKIAKVFKKKGINISVDEAAKLQGFYNEATNLPAPYFEAKPQRFVWFNEVAVVVIPSDTSESLKSALSENNIRYIEYEKGNDKARLDVLNSLDDVKFSERGESDAVDTIGSRNLADFAEAKNSKGEALFQYRAMEADEAEYRDMLSKWGKMNDEQIDNLFATIDKAMDVIKDNLEVLDYAWEADIDDRAFSPVKPNSDSLYKVSLDFSTLCRKRILQQTIQAQLQEALNQPLTREEGIAIRDALMALQEEGRQIEVACALCYVESARMKSPAQIKKFLNTRETVLKEFFAGKSGGSMKAKIKQAEVDTRETLHKENPNGIKGKDGSILDPRTAPLKAMPKKYADPIRYAKRSAKAAYNPTAEEQKLIDVAKGMSVSDFTSPEGLENLAKNYPALFDAYTSYIRNATKSKGIEGDTWWRAGDSQKIGDVLIANMNKENGLRSQSWSDFQVIHILDYIAATIELSTRNAKEQAYSKVPDYVELMGQTGVMINMSLIPTREFNGSLDYDSVEGMAYKRALELREKYPATAGTICIGVDNKQIQMLLADSTIDYVIPYHKSGMAASVRKLMHIPTWSQYEEYQSEKNLSRKDAEAQAKKYGVKLLAESDPNYHKHTSFSEWFDVEVAKQIAKMENTNPSDKSMQKKYGVMYGGYMAMQDAANNYLKLCAERGIAPKFSHEKADFTAEDNYWKLLIDRKMVNNATGEIIEQQAIKPIFDEGEVLRILNDELARYPSIKADQDYATRKVTEKFLSGEIKSGMSAEAIAKVMKTPVDNIAKTNILASVEGETIQTEYKLSERDLAPTFYSQMGKVVEGVKQDKLAANSVVNMLRGKGVKAEEIRWSGIVPFLEGKKSVTKQELLDFINGSMLQIGEQTSSNDIDLRYDTPSNSYTLYDANGKAVDTYTYNEFIGGYVSNATEEIYSNAVELEDALREEYGSMSSPRWSDYKLDGGSNYRELVFTMPNSTYSNNAMRAHWGEDAEGVLVHARIQDFDVNGKKMLFIEELQSDWHNEGHKDGYQEDAKFKELQELEAKANEAFYALEDYSTELTGLAGEYEAVAKTQKGRELLRAKFKAEKELKQAQAQFDSKVPNAPFKDNYHEFVLKRLIRMAAEQGYDSIGWTPADIQSQRWSDEFAEGYRIEYDQDMPKFLKKYGRQWGATVGSSVLNNGTEIWSMDITDSMKESVLYEGQVMYSERVIAPITETEYRDLEKNFGTTGNFKVAGYLLTNGKLLDFSGKHWGDTTSKTRQVDHREAEEILNRGNNGINAMVDMIGNGNIRLMPEIGGINLAVYPNEKQRRVLSVYINYMLNTEGQIVIDYDSVGGDTVHSKTYGKTATSRQILNDIRNYFNGARQSELMSFHTMYSDRDPSSSNRAILANALEGAAQNDIEKNKLAEYKKKISLIESEEQRLSEIHSMLFTKGAVDPKQRKELQFEARQIANRINTYDRQLLNLESTAALKNVLNREKALAMKRQKQKDNEALNRYKERVAKTQRELLERHQESRKKAIEGREKTAVRHKIKSVVNDLNTLLLKPTKERHVPEEMKIAVAEALEIVNMDTVDAETRAAKYNDLIAKAKDPDVIASLTETRDRILKQGNKLADKLTKLKDAYGMVRDSADDSVRSMYDDVIYNKIESVQRTVGKTPLRNMTLGQLESVYDLYRMVLTTVRDSNKAFAENIKETRLALGSNTFAEIKENNRARDAIKHPSLEKFMWQNLKPMQAIKSIGSGTLSKLWNNVLYGQETFARDYDEAVKFAKEMKEKYGYKKWNLDKLYSFDSKSGKAMKLNLEQMMSVYAYSKRQQADEHIEYGGIVLNEGVIKVKNKLGKTVEVKVNDSTAYRLDKMQVGEIIATLEKEFPGAKDFVDEMQKYLSETMGEKGNEVAMKMYGIKLFKEEHYFPLKSSKDFMEAANAKLKGDVKIKNKGMTKAVVEHARNPIVLEGFLDVWGNHVNEMAMYHGLVLPLEDFSRTLNYSFKADETLNTDAESVRTALHDAFGESADNYLNELLKAINGGVLHDSSAEFADKMISKFKKAKVMASLSVIIQQPTAIIRSMGIIEPKYFIHQSINHKKTWEELKKYCPTAIIKETGSFDTNMGKTIVDMIKEDDTFIEKVGDTLGKAPAYMDEIGWNCIWRALKKKIATEQKLSGEELLQECGKQMTLILNETQVYDSTMSRNELMRSKNALTKMATAFMAEPTTVANMIYGAALDFKRGKKGIAGKTVAAVVSSVVINGLVSSLVYALRDDDDDETILEKYISSATTEVLDGLNPLTYIPFIKDAYSLFQGYDVERTDMAIIGDVVDAVNAFYDVLDPEAYEGMSRKQIASHIYENTKPLLTSICDMFGLPVGNVMRDAEAIIFNDNIPISQTSSSGTKYALKEGASSALPKIVGKVIGTETKGDKLYDAILSGDTTYLKRLKSAYKDDKSYETAVRKALRENDSRIREAAELRKSGEVTECFNLIDKIASEGHFARTLIIKAVNAELEALKKQENQ